MLAAATIAASATAGELVPSLKTVNAKIDTRNEAVLTAENSSFRAPSYAAAEYPADLDGTSALFKFTILEEDKNGVLQEYSFSPTVTFSNAVVDGEAIQYTMTNFITGLYNEQVITPDLTVVYFPSAGLLYLLSDQNFATVPLTSGGTADMNLWMANGDPEMDGYYSRLNAQFQYEDGAFKLVNPMEVWYEDEDEPTTFTAKGLALGTVINNGLTLFCEFAADDFAIYPVAGGGNMTFIMTNKSGAQEMDASVGAGINGDVLTVYSFAGMFDVPMTIDAAAKTLTANNVQVTSITDVKAYLSEQAADGSNAAGSRKYVLKSTYTVADGKTTVTVPDWNAFYYQFGVGEASYFWPMSNTKIVFDFDLDELASAGVDGIAADAAVDANAPVEYFNLQGIRVATPEAGQLLIKRQGNKATKVVIR